MQILPPRGISFPHCPQINLVKGLAGSALMGGLEI